MFRPSYINLTLEASFTTAFINILSLFFRENKTMFQVNPLLGMKNQALFSSKNKSKKLKCRLLQIFFGALRVKNLD